MEMDGSARHPKKGDGGAERLRAAPKRPEQLLAGIIELQKMVQKTGTLTGREFIRRTQATGPTPFERDELIRIREAGEQLSVLI